MDYENLNADVNMIIDTHYTQGRKKIGGTIWQ